MCTNYASEPVYTVYTVSNDTRDLLYKYTVTRRCQTIDLRVSPTKVFIKFDNHKFSIGDRLRVKFKVIKIFKITDCSVKNQSD